jgi:hypothetical protein
VAGQAGDLLRAAHSIWVIEPNRYVGVADVRRSDKAAAAGY